MTQSAPSSPLDSNPSNSVDRQPSQGKTSVTDNSGSYITFDKQNQEVAIELATSENLTDIVDIYNQSIVTKVSTADLKAVTVADRQMWFDDHLNNAKRPIYVVKNSNNELMAWGSFSNVKNRPAYDISSEISIYVSYNFQRRGLASILLAYMLEQAPSLGIRNILALIFAHNTPSLNLFKQFGFERWGYMPNICDMGDFTADVITLGKVVSHDICNKRIY